MKIISFDILAPFYDFFAGIFRRRIPSKIKSRIKPGEYDVILDLGGGTGYNSARIADAGQRVIVFDISFKMLQRAQKYKNLHLVVGDARMLPFKDKCFDIVMAVDSLHHVMDYPGVLREVSRTGKNKFFVAEFFGLTPMGRLFTKLERLFLPIVYRSPGKFSREALRHGIQGYYEYISSFEYFFSGTIQ